MDDRGMKFHFYLVQLSLLLILLIEGGVQTVSSKDHVTNFSWYTPRPILGYRSYQDVFPERFEVPQGLSQVFWTFRTSDKTGNCEDDYIQILLQHSGLPLVIQTNLSFPDDFIVHQSPTVRLYLRPALELKISVLRPPGGSWYGIAFTKGVNQKIQQKGLTSSAGCQLFFTSLMTYGEPIKKTEVATGRNNSLLVKDEDKFISFTVAPGTYAFDLIVFGCDAEYCNITVQYKPFDEEGALSETCLFLNGSSEPCVMHVPSPPYLDEQIVLFQSDDETGGGVAVTYSIEPHECFSSKSLVQSGPCFSLPEVGRINTVQPLEVRFGYMIDNRVLALDAPGCDLRVIVVPFTMTEPMDIGGTLEWKMKMGNVQENLTSGLDVYLCGALVYDHLPDMYGDFKLCDNVTSSVIVSGEEKTRNESIRYVPYPRAGIWHIMVQASCFFSDNGSETTCPEGITASMSLRVEPCLGGDCNGNGQCSENTVGSDLVTVGSCKCYAGYQGYACTDGTHALSNFIQMCGALLLTLSNLFFVPSIIIAVRRKYYLETFVYFYTMIFSTFYHACDGNRIDHYRVCIMRFDVLQSGDFFGSSCSLWFTMVAMARIRRRWVTPMLQIVGPFSLFIGVVYDKTSILVIAVPVLCGLLAIIVSWGHKMYKRRHLYPSLKRYLFYLLPGTTLAITGAAVFAFLETEDNYKYLHSVWHMTIASSICFLLPPKNIRLADPVKPEGNMYLLNSVDGGQHDPPPTTES